MSKTWFECKSTAPKTAAIAIYDEIGSYGVTAKSFTDELKALGPVGRIELSLNSGGGDVFDGIAIYHALRRHPAEVVATVDGIAASIASVIAMAADEIEMPESAWMMIHDPSGFVMGTEKDMTKMGETLRGIKQSLVGIYAKRTGIDSGEIEDLMASETWMDGPDALARGFADRVTDSDVAIAASVNFSKFSNVPEGVRGLTCGSAAPSAIQENEMAKDTKTDVAATDQPEDKKAERAKIVDEMTKQSTVHETKDQKPGPWSGEADPGIQGRQVQGLTEADVTARAEKLAAAKMARIQGAYTAGRNLGLQAETQKLIDDGVDPAEIPEILIEVHAKREQNRSQINSLAPSGVNLGFSNEDPAVFRSRMSDAIAARFSNGVTKCPDASRQYMSWQPMDIMRDSIERTGRDTRRMTKVQIVDAALHTTSDFPYLLGESANKIFLGAYDSAPATFREIAGRVDLANFQTHNLLRDGDFPQLAEVMESGEFTYGTMSESKETAKLATYGRTFAISRHSLVNDSLGVFGRTSFKIGQAVARYENSKVWSAIIANAAISDGDAFFHSNHGNLTGSGTVINAANLGIARATMRVQKSLDNETLNISPRSLVVPAAKETTAEQTLSALVVPEQPSNLTPASLRSLMIIAEPLLDASSATAWYLFSDPAMGAAFVYGYLEGDTAPRIRTNDPFNVDGIEFQVRLDFHVAAADYRFAYKNNGA